MDDDNKNQVEMEGINRHSGNEMEVRNSQICTEEVYYDEIDDVTAQGKLTHKLKSYKITGINHTFSSLHVLC